MKARPKIAPMAALVLMLSVMLPLPFGAAGLGSTLRAEGTSGGKVHPFTQQMTDQWLAQLNAAEAASRPGQKPEAARTVLQAAESFFREKQQTLARHPDYERNLLRQVTLRIKLARITAVMGLLAADLAVKTSDASLLNRPKDGAYAELKNAEALTADVAAVIGTDQEAYTGLVSYVANVRAKVDEKAGQIKTGGVATAAPAGAYVHPYTQQVFEKWVEGLEFDRGIAAGNEPLDRKLRELEGGRSYFLSNQNELRKHPNFSQAVPSLLELQLTLGALKVQKAIEFAETGVRDANPNFFNAGSGISQQLAQAEEIQKFCLTLPGADAEACAKLAQTITEGRATVAKLEQTLKGAAAASYRLPPEKYTGSDKDALREQVLAAWKERYPNDKVLGTRFASATWRRKKESKYNNGTWYHTDMSVLTLYVIVQTSAEMATVYPAYANKNHNEGDAITMGVNTKGSSYVHEEILLKNLDL